MRRGGTLGILRRLFQKCRGAWPHPAVKKTSKEGRLADNPPWYYGINWFVGKNLSQDSPAQRLMQFPANVSGLLHSLAPQQKNREKP